MKKLSKFILSGSVLLASSPIISMTTNKEEVNVDQHKKEMILLSEFFNSDNSEFIKENYESIQKEFKLMKENQEILNFVRTISNFENIENLLNKIMLLNVSLFQKKILVSEYKRFLIREKDKRKETKTGRTWSLTKYIEARNNPNMPDYDVLYKGEHITKNGYDLFTITDNVFEADVSYIAWSNMTILQNFISNAMNKVENMSNKDEFIDSIKITEVDKENEMYDVDYSEFVEKVFNNNPYLSKAYVQMRNLKAKEKNNEIITSLRLIKFLKAANKISVWNFDSYSSFLSTLKSSLGTTFSKIASHPKVVDLLQYIKQVFNVGGGTSRASSLIKLWPGVSTVLSKLTRAYHVVSAGIALIDVFSTVKSDYIDVKALANFVNSTVNVAITSFLMASSTIGAPVAIVALAYFGLEIFLKSYVTGNGKTIYENFNDHGLNDWEYQMKNNRDVMLATALEFSENLKYGVTWKVTDGWFSYPDLYISRSLYNYQQNKFVHISELPYTLLSPNNEFNFGNKIKFKKA